jgi:hypothetical protein
MDAQIPDDANDGEIRALRRNHFKQHLTPCRYAKLQ